MQQILSFKYSIQVAALGRQVQEAQLISFQQAQAAEQRDLKQAIETGLELE